jgi:hypothetical protein
MICTADLMQCWSIRWTGDTYGLEDICVQSWRLNLKETPLQSCAQLPVSPDVPHVHTISMICREYNSGL